MPFFAVCENCGRIYTTRAYTFEPKTDKVLYKCEGLEIRGEKSRAAGTKAKQTSKKVMANSLGKVNSPHAGKPLTSGLKLLAKTSLTP